MRVLHVAGNPVGLTFAGGIEKAAYCLTSALAELGHEVLTFAVLDQRFDPPDRVVAWHVSGCGLVLPRGLAGAVLEFNPEVVHFHGAFNPRFPVLARRLRRSGIPYGISPHGMAMPAFFERRRMRKEAYLGLFERSYWQSASFVHAISEAEARTVRRLAPRSNIFVAHYGCGGAPESLDRDYIRRRYPGLHGKRVFGFLGRLDVIQKGLDTLVEACAAVRPALGDVALVLAGPDFFHRGRKGRSAALRRRVRELGLGDLVLFPGPVFGEEKFDFLAACDVFVHPSRWEAGIPLSVLEALEVGRPCLVTDVPNFGDFFRSYRAGVQVPLTVEGVSQGLRFFAQANPAGLAAMGAEGRRGVLQEFSWWRTAEALVQAYEQARGKTPLRSAAVWGVPSAG